jgi:hypothetical protein
MLKIILLLVLVYVSVALVVEVETSDHVDCDMDTLDLTEDQLQMVMTAFNSPRIQNEQFIADAAATHWVLSPHQMFRYLVSGGWTGTYNGKEIVDAALNTVRWRKTFNIHAIDTYSLLPALEQDISFVSGYDKDNRALLYFKLGNLKRKISPELMIQFLMYSVERADRYSVELGSGEFVAIIDLKGMSFSNSPSFTVIQTALNLLKYNYPYRLNSLIIINGGSIFTTFWSLIKPIMPARALAKTHVLSKSEMPEALYARVGKEYLEKEYGGNRDPISDIKAYVEQGYWYVHRPQEGSHVEL